MSWGQSLVMSCRWTSWRLSPSLTGAGTAWLRAPAPSSTLMEAGPRLVSTWRRGRCCCLGEAAFHGTSLARGRSLEAWEPHRPLRWATSAGFPTCTSSFSTQRLLPVLSCPPSLHHFLPEEIPPPSLFLSNIRMHAHTHTLSLSCMHMPTRYLCLCVTHTHGRAHSPPVLPHFLSGTHSVPSSFCPSPSLSLSLHNSLCLPLTYPHPDAVALTDACVCSHSRSPSSLSSTHTHTHTHTRTHSYSCTQAQF
mmetsp:Transcript_34634/g.98141  ORF Transcript_34634/g.98141 Transcript_34634/m.98141 type:complete len:250 (-) Transcript_34634:999-1748(-)